MTSAASHSPEFPQGAGDSGESESLQPPASRPALVSPPRRPVRPQQVETPPEPTPSAPPPANPEPTPVEVAAPSPRYQPIAPPSEPMQYRAIGMARGRYQPEEEQFNRGHLTTEEGTHVPVVLLGRVTSLVKNHLDLESSHLWVVYPRTRGEGRGDSRRGSNNVPELHLQIVGVWEPETLGLPGQEPHLDKTSDESDGESPDVPDADAPEATAPETAAASPAEPEAADAVDAPEAEAVDLDSLPPVDDNYFSIRGEVVNYDEDKQRILVKILQISKRDPQSKKAFQLTVQGQLQGRTVGYFWDLHVKRDGTDLVMTDGRVVGIVPPKKRRKQGGRPKSRGGPGARSGGPRPRPRLRQGEERASAPSSAASRSSSPD